MTEETDKPDLQAAYDLTSPDDNKRLYRAWAQTYDEAFIAAKAYDYPQKIADLFDQRGGEGPVLDVGCGTGAVAEALKARPVDGVDISAEMLEAARAKTLYRALIETDLTDNPALPDAAYHGVVSAGTFTHGHVGPEALMPLVKAAAPDALFVLGVNVEVFAALPFEKVLGKLTSTGEIHSLEFVEGRIYGDHADHDHAADIFRALLFRRRDC